MNGTPNAVTPQQSFEDKLKAKIQKDIGDLMPDEMLRDLVTKSIDKMFFEPVRVVSHGYGNRDKLLPSEFESIVVNAMEPLLCEAVEDWIASNQDLLRTKMDEALGNGGDQLVCKAMQRFFAPAFNELDSHFQQRLMNIESRIA